MRKEPKPAEEGDVSGKMNGNLLYELEKYERSGSYPLHMPGHKRNIRHFTDPFAIDITEIEGFDNLFHAQGMLLEAQRNAARLYGSEETYYLVNGSTCGILAAISASVKRGGHLLMARNSHKAAYHGAFLRGLHVSYLYPGMDMNRGINGSIRPGQVKEALSKEPDIQAVLITSPTYDGIVSDIREIAAAVHRAGAVLIVDEAHGAHLGMHPSLPHPALSCGADIVINSLHKTLPSLTQTAVLHVNGPLADREKIRRYLGIYESSSPSYVLMAGMDACITMLEEQGPQLFEVFMEHLGKLRESLGQMQVLHLVSGKEKELYCYEFDPSKVLISTEDSPMTGPELSQILRLEYRLEVEMEAEHYVTAIMTIGDTKEGFARLEHALLEIDGRLAAAGGGSNTEKRKNVAYAGMTAENRESSAGMFSLEANEEAMSMEEAENIPWETVPLKDSAGRISVEFAYLYPPGIPLLVPGERIAGSLPGRLDYYRFLGLKLQGMADYSGSTIRVAVEKTKQ